MVLACSTHALAAGFTLTDITMANANWSASKFQVGASSTSHTSTQSTAGGGGTAGAADPYMRVVHTIGGGQTSLYVFHGFLPSLYDPTVDGEIVSVDFALAYRTFNLAVNLTPSLLQGGVLYRAPGITMTTADTSWDTVSFTGLTATDFVGLQNGLTPDFSAMASSILFGFTTANGTVNAGVTTTSGYDDFSLTVTSEVPEPATFGLVAVGLLAAVHVSRRRRQLPSGAHSGGLQFFVGRACDGAGTHGGQSGTALTTAES